jgi:hypothetical protein
VTPTPFVTLLCLVMFASFVSPTEVFLSFQMMDAIKGTMTEIYNDLSKNTTGSTIAEVSRSGESPEVQGSRGGGCGVGRGGVGSWAGSPWGPWLQASG